MTIILGCSVTPAKKYVRFGLNGKTIGAQRPNKQINKYVTVQPRLVLSPATSPPMLRAFLVKSEQGKTTLGGFGGFCMVSFPRSGPKRTPRHKDLTNHDFWYPPLYWSLEPECEILVFLWSFVPLQEQVVARTTWLFLL